MSLVRNGVQKIEPLTTCLDFLDNLYFCGFAYILLFCLFEEEEKMTSDVAMNMTSDRTSDMSSDMISYMTLHPS